MSKRIDKIVIVGGGTAGWMSAAFLNRTLSKASGRDISITVVESDDVGIIGVGEATIPSIRKMMQIIGLPEWKLFTEADAAFKNAIKFIDWVRIPEDGKHSHYYHQFDPPIAADGWDAMTHWMALKNSGVEVPTFHDAVSVSAALSDHHRGPKMLNDPPYQSAQTYAYHVDTIKLGRMLRELAMERGVNRIVDHVTSVEQTETGDIKAIKTRDGRTIEADFFVDCSGFRALLIEGTLKEPFIDYSDRLLCDSAVAGQVDYEEGAIPRPYTVANAKSAGWIWEIDLSHRSGTGYVYSSKFIDDDAAEKEWRAHFGKRGEKLEPRRIKMRIGRRDNFWVGNCCAIGLAGGFIEPIESTGIHLAELGLVFLVDYLAEGGESAVPLRKYYNKVMRDVYDEVCDFIQVHYLFNQRHGQPFWDAYRNTAISPALAEQIEIWKYRMPTRTDLFKSRINVFDGYNISAVLGGVEMLPKEGAITPFINLKTSMALLEEVQKLRTAAVRSYPLQMDLIRKLRSMETS